MNASKDLAPRDAELIKSLHPGLRTVLDRELHAGNEIREISTGWPKPTSVLIVLRSAFKASNATPPGIVYNEINDPHYWLAEFCHEESSQIVACPFPR